MNDRKTLSSHLEERASILGEHLPKITIGAGCILLILPFLTYPLIPELGVGDLLSHIVFAVPFVAGMTYGGYWLKHSDLARNRWLRIGKWFLGGLIAFLSLNLAMMLVLGNSVSVSLHPYWAFFAADVGGGASLAIGIFEARAIEQERLAEQRRLHQKAARRRSKQFENFAKIVSHDLRNPLNVAGGRLQLAKEEDDPAHLAAVEDALSRMDEIIEDVLMLTWSGQDMTSEDVTLLRLGEVAQAAWSNVDAPDATLRIEENPTVCANDRRLQRLLENLLRNAVEHGGSDVTIRVGMLSDGFFVEDDGPGIPEEKRDHVFDPGCSTSEEGTGLGLNIVKAIAEAHGWTVSATEGRDGGARFAFTGISNKHRDSRARPPQRTPEPARSDVRSDSPSGTERL